MKIGGCTSACQDIDELPRAVLPPIPDNRPGSIPLPTERSQGASARRERGAPKERQRAKSGGSPGATPRHSGHAASTSAADLRDPSRDDHAANEPARQVKIEGDGSEATREAGRQCRRARGEKSPSGDWSGLPGYLGPPRATSMGRKGPRNPPREGMPLTHQRDRSMGKRGPRIRPRDDDVGGHPAESPPGSRQRMSRHAVGWFLRNTERAFATMDDGQLNHVSETLNHEMGQRGGDDSEPEPPRGARSQSRAGRERSRPPPGGEQTEEEAANEPGSRARSRSKAVTRRRAQWRIDHGLPPREEEWAESAAAAAAAGADEPEEDEVELGQADYSTNSPPRGGSTLATWR